MLSEPPVASATTARRDSLKLSFNRSFSEPHAPHSINAPILSPPSLSPSLHHPTKRCRMDPPSSCSLRPPQVPTSMTMTPTPAGTVSLPASPFNESSTLQRTLLLQKVDTMLPKQLAARMVANTDFLLVDCRPFIAYNVNHISGAINVNCCDRFNRKRLQQGKATLADLATTKEGKEMLKKRSWKEVVVYDDCSESLEKLPSSHTLFLVMKALVEDNREPVMLLGGLRDFLTSHRNLCEDHLMGSQGACAPVGGHILPALPSPTDICDTKDIENHPPTLVLPYLFLGNMRDASDAAILHRLGIKYVLNVTAKAPEYVCDPRIVYKQLFAADNGVQNLRQFFDEAFEFIDRARTDPDQAGVLIHCNAGVSRSPTIAIAYLMNYYPMGMAEAYKFIKQRRSIISPNLNFMGQLWEFEQGLRAPGDMAEECKLPLTMEMKEMLQQQQQQQQQQSLSTSGTKSFLFESSVMESKCQLKSESSFRWSDSTAVQAQPKEADVTSGCSV